MYQAIRATSAFTVALALAVPMHGAPPAKQSEYKQDDKSFYSRSDVLKADPNAVIVPESAVTQGTGDASGSFFVPAHKHPAKVIYVLKTADWIEPITPPSMPGNLNIALDVMQIREPQGDVQVALPSAPGNFTGVSDTMVIPNGSVLKTGGNGTAAVLFGGVDSVRLTPNSQAAVQLVLKPGSRDAEVDLHSGIAFSKVGLRIGEKESYEVHTPFGIATAHGTDFVTAALPQRTDVWVAQGTVELNSPDGNKVASVVSEGKGVLKVMRNPAAKDPQTGLAESSESLSQVVAFIPIANQKLKALHDRSQSGAKLTSTETDYISRIRTVPFLMKLTYVAPPAPPPAPVVVTPPPAPKMRMEAKPAPKVASSSGMTADPSSLIPGAHQAKKIADSESDSSSSSDGGTIRTGPRKINLDLRDQDNSPSAPGKPPDHGPADTIP